MLPCLVANCLARFSLSQTALDGSACTTAFWFLHPGTGEMNGYDRRHFLTTPSVPAPFPWGHPGCSRRDRRWSGPATDQDRPDRHGHKHASAKMATFRNLADHYEVVGVVEPDPAVAQETRQRSGLSRPEVDDRGGVVQHQGARGGGGGNRGARTRAHGRTLHRGRHALPLGQAGRRNVEPFKKMLDEAGRRGLAVQLGYMYRNNPAVQFCQRAVREGWLGQVFEVHAVMSRQQPLAYRQWLGQFRGGTMYIFGCHLIDLVVSMLGKPDRVTPYQRQTQPEVKVYDNGLAVSSIRVPRPRSARRRSKSRAISGGSWWSAATRGPSIFGRWRRSTSSSATPQAPAGPVQAARLVHEGLPGSRLSADAGTLR